jgi:ADP-ribosyl-[dinitrogen reductase] hydrolase
MAIDLSRIEGALLGTMVGDSLGLPREALSRRRAMRMFRGPVRHRFLFGRGMVSDDTEHSWFVAQSLLEAKGNSDAFARALAWKLRLWFLTLPAGIGVATLRAIIKLWVGFPPASSGVWSAGNGPAMRSAILGVFFAGNDAALREHVRCSARLTHTDPRAERGALAIASAARYAASHDRAGFSATELLAHLRSLFPPDDAEAASWLSVLERAIGEPWDADRVLAALGCPRGVSGYVYHTVPAALAAWLIDPFDFRRGMERILSLGGDADTTAAIFGGMCGALVGVEGIPPEWISGIWEFPRSVAWTNDLARRLHAAQASSYPSPPSYFWPLIPLRNSLFLAAVLAHGIRRIFPPY